VPDQPTLLWRARGDGLCVRTLGSRGFDSLTSRQVSTFHSILQISGEALVTTTMANSALELRDPAGNTPALTITPLAGGTHPTVASIVIQQLG
jgi:hypothetical protein